MTNIESKNNDISNIALVGIIIWWVIIVILMYNIGLDIFKENSQNIFETWSIWTHIWYVIWLFIPLTLISIMSWIIYFTLWIKFKNNHTVITNILLAVIILIVTYKSASIIWAFDHWYALVWKFMILTLVVVIMRFILNAIYSPKQKPHND